MPALAPVVDAIDQVPEGARSFYVPKDGKFHLDLAGAPAGFVSAADHAAANAKVIEFRDTNVALLKEVEPLRALKGTIGDLNVEEAKAALAAQKALKDKGVNQPDDVTALITRAVEAAVTPLRSALDAMTSANAANEARANEATLRSTVGDVFLKAGGEAGALNFIITEAQKVFAVEGGATKAKAGFYSETRPGEALSIEEWVAQQTKANSFAFKPSGGGGASPVPGAGGLPRTGVAILKDPTPAQLGDPKTVAEMRAGRLRVEYSS